MTRESGLVADVNWICNGLENALQGYWGVSDRHLNTKSAKRLAELVGALHEKWFREAMRATEAERQLDLMRRELNGLRQANEVITNLLETRK